MMQKITFLAVLVLMISIATIQHSWAEPLLKRESDYQRQQQAREQREQQSYEMYQRMEVLQEEIQMLRGQVEEQAYEIEMMKKSQRDRYIDLDQRVTDLSNRPVPTPVTVAPVDTTIDLAVPELGNEKGAYDRGKALVNTKQYDSAIVEFSLYLEAYPQGQYVAQANYWLGELYMVLTFPDYENARKHFEKVLTDYPAHPKVPDSMFKLGRVYDLEGNKTKAQEKYKEVVKEFPKSVSANLAREYLK